MEANEVLTKLAEPFEAEAIDWRVGATNGDKTKGIALAYLQARPVMDRLDTVMGPENWIDSYEPIQGSNGPVGFICTLALRLNGEWITKTDASDTSDIEPIKGGVSDSFKRAAVKWGVGRYLYDLPTIWEPIEARGKSHVLKSTPKLPAWALPKKGQSRPSAAPAQDTSDIEPTGQSDFITDTQELDPMTDPYFTGLNSESQIQYMTLEDACKVRNSKDTLYMDLSKKTLSNMSIGIGKALAAPDLDPDLRLGYLTKQQAIKLLLQAKNEGSIK